VDANFNLEVENKLTNNSVMRQLRSDRAFCNNDVDRPTQFACDGMLLDSRVAIINDPLGFLKDCVSEENIDAYNTKLSKSKSKTPGIKLTSLPNFDSPAIVNASLQQAILNLALPKGTCTTQTYTTVKDLLVADTTNNNNSTTSNAPKVYESKPNLASAMKDHHLRTLCSVSGTTTDIVAALWGMNEEKTKAALQSLKNAVPEITNNNNNNNSTNSLPTVDPAELSPEFKNLFLSIAMYMQSGQYHSAASVLCGLYCAAMSLVETAAQTVVSIASYSALLQAFANNPTAFFPPVAV
jgi:hypothetical protein